MYYEEKNKKKKSSFWLVFFLIMMVVLSVAGFIVYKKIQAPVEDEIQKYAYINVMTFYDDELVTTGIIIEENGVEKLNSKSSDRGATTLKVYFNNSVTISTFNLENQSYILDSQEFYIDSIEPVQVKFRLEKMAKIDIDTEAKRDYVAFTIENVDEKDFGELLLFVKPRGAVIPNSEIDMERISSTQAVEVGYDKAYIVSENLEDGRTIQIEIPFIKVSNEPTIDYWFGNLQESPVLGYQIVGGEGGTVEV